MLPAYVNVSFRRVALGAALAVFLMGSAQAQTAAPADPATPAVPTVGQPEPPEAQLAAARELVVASGMARSFSPMVGQLMDQVIPLLTRTHPELRANLTKSLTELKPDFEKKGEGMTDIAAHIYARRMSEQDLKEAVAFFNSPAGKNYVAVQPGMLDELVVSMQSWTQELSTYMMTKLHDSMKAKGQDF